METKYVMMLCNQRVAEAFIEMDENFKQVICICPWLDDNDANNDSVLVVDKSAWDKLVDVGEVYLREDVVGVKEHEDD